MSSGLLPVHGFVLAGGKSSRMGQDKALLPFRGRPMVEIAVEKLRSFCVDVSIAGNRDDLAAFAPVVHESRIDAGPGAGIEAGLRAATQPWTIFIPVDTPLVSVTLLRNFASAVLRFAKADEAQDEMPQGGYLIVHRESQPAFCVLPALFANGFAKALDKGERRLIDLLDLAGRPGSGVLPMNASRCIEEVSATDLQMEFWFSNVNTPQEFAEAEAWAEAADSQDS